MLAGNLKDDNSKLKLTSRSITLTHIKTGKAENRLEYAHKITSNE